jgi:hypothetical protein
MSEVIIQGDIEAQILRLVNELEEETSVYASQIEEAARADITYKREFSRAQVMLAADQPKLTVATREAKAMQMAMDEMAVAKILAARERATREKLTSLRTRLDALRTLSANVRAQT